MAYVDYAWYVSSHNSTHGYQGVTQWATGAKTAGTIVRQVFGVALGNERVFICIVAGTSGGSQPAWNLTRGALTTDNTVTWQEITGNAAINGDVANTAAWSVIASTSVSLGQVIKNNAATHYFIASVAGTAGSSQPTFNTTTGATTVDSGVTWTCIGAVSSYTQCYRYPHATVVTANSANWGQDGNTFYIFWGQSENWNTSVTLNGGTYALPRYYITTDELNTPPGGANVQLVILFFTNGGISMASAGNTMQIGCGAGNCQYWAGMAFWTNPGNLQIGCASGAAIRFSSPFFRNNSGTGVVQIGCPISGNNIGSIVEFACDKLDTTGGGNNQIGSSQSGSFPWQIQGGTVIFRNSNIQMPNTFTSFFAASPNGGSHTALFQGCSVAGSGSPTTTALVNPTNLQGRYSFVNCNVNSFNNQPIVSTTPTIPLAGTQIDIIDTDGSDTPNRNERYNYAGTSTVGFWNKTPFIWRNGGAVDGDVPVGNFCRKVVTTANANYAMPFEDFQMVSWYTYTNPFNKTANVYCFLLGGGAIPTNGDIWLELQYKDQTGTPHTTIVSSAKANILATGTQYASDTSGWGSGLSGTAFVISTPLFSPQNSGYIYGVIKVAKASYTVYYDPVLYIV